ncbi:hypothetical protein PR048_018553 [Dryococelus australis]|uniref:Uncharacterized protein n=1 Tax=Dryococelus australis TaxID=614101 RepID=A0ABQ9HCQ8_9NEOP|nr:hypothetical protein PR048_018553 [Dryococelus australis]
MGSVYLHNFSAYFLSQLVCFLPLLKALLLLPAFFTTCFGMGIYRLKAKQVKNMVLSKKHQQQTLLTLGEEVVTLQTMTAMRDTCFSFRACKVIFTILLISPVDMLNWNCSKCKDSSVPKI